MEELKSNIPAISFKKSKKWCTISQLAGKNFAYMTLAKKKAKLDIWTLGDLDYVKQKYRYRIKFKSRKETVGYFGALFKINFLIEDLADIKKAIPLLVEVSNSWSEKELMLIYNLYSQIPVKDMHSNSKTVIYYSELIGKPAKEVSKKFLNFYRLDKENLIKNIEEYQFVRHSFNQDWEKNLYESENKIIELEYRLNNRLLPQGKEREGIVKTRINQSFFRKAVLSAYKNKCCITSLPYGELLNASHIIPWKDDVANRLNPANGLCLNTLHDRAFDKGLITITTNYKVRISHNIAQFINNQSIKKYFLRYEDKKIKLPDKFIPDIEFLNYHNKYIFRG